MKSAWFRYKSVEIKYKLWLLIQPVGGGKKNLKKKETSKLKSCGLYKEYIMV